MKVLVTGGVGCIGLALVRNLMCRGIDTVCFDLPEKILQAKSLGIQLPNATPGSILDRNAIEEAMPGITHVVHLAAHLGVRRTEIERKKCLDVNIIGTKNVVEIADTFGVTRIINASSSEVYGRPEKKKLNENDKTQGFSVYAIAKLASEELIKAQCQISPNSLTGVNLRFFNTFGPYQVAQFVVPKFMSQALAGDDLVVNGRGTQIRSYCYVDDIVEGIISSLNLRLHDRLIETFNLGNPNNEIDLVSLANLVIATVGDTNSKVKIMGTFDETDREEIREINYRVCDISHAQKELNFQPKIQLADAVAKLKSEFINIPSWPELA